MSRSYRKHTYVTDKQRNKCPHRLKSKTIANRMIRRTDDIVNNAAYRRIYDSWDICDWKFTLSENEFKHKWKNGHYSEFKSYRQAYRWWYTSFKRK